MNKIFKLIYINLLGLFDINKIIVARSEGVKSNLEKKFIITCLIALFYGYVIYTFFTLFNLNDYYMIIKLGFVLSFFFCFISDLFIIEPILFKNSDNDMLFSLPITREQILFSKLFIVYVRNLIYTIIIMGAVLLSYLSYGAKVSDLFVLMFIISIFIIPLIPIVIATIFAYLNDLFKLKTNDSILFRLCKLLIIIFILLGVVLLFKNIFVDYDDVNNLFEIINNKIRFLCPLVYLFELALMKENILCFAFLVFIPIVVVWVYSLFITNNYLRMCSLLKGVRKGKLFVYKNNLNLKQIGGMIRKELLFIFHNKIYFKSSVSGLVIFSIVLFVLLNLVDISYFKDINNFDIYFNTYLPMILAMFVTLNNSCISAFSLEKDNMQMLITMPIKMSKIIFAKWLSSVLIGIIFVIVNGTMVLVYLDLDKWVVFYSYIIPFIALLFVTFSSLIVDYRFIEKNEKDDNTIIKGRLVSLVPSFLAVFIGIGPFFLPLYVNYEMLLGSYALGMSFLMVFELIYLILFNKKLKMNLFN